MVWSDKRIKGYLNNLTGQKKVLDTTGYQYTFQPGLNTVICNAWAGGVNIPVVIESQSDDAGTHTWPTANSTNTYYFWDQKVTQTIQNYSPQNVYITARYCQAREQVPTSAIPNTTMTSLADPTLEILHTGWHERTNSLANLENALQGYYGIGNYQWGEGLGHAAPGAQGSPVNIDFVNHPVLLAESIPIGLSVFDSRHFTTLFKVYKSQKFVLPPGGQHTLSLTDRKLKYRQKDDEAVWDDIDMWDGTKWEFNSHSKFIILEVHGSLIGQDPHSASTGKVSEETWNVTSTHGDANIDFSAIVNEVSLHGGVLRVVYHREMNVGIMEDIKRPASYVDILLDNIGNPGDAYSKHTGEAAI